MTALSIVVNSDCDVVRISGGKSIVGLYALHIEVDKPFPMKLLEIALKCSSTIVAQGLVEDDSLCERIKMQWTDAIPGRAGPVRVWLISTTGDVDA